MPGELDHKAQPDLDHLRPRPSSPAQRRVQRPPITSARDPRLAAPSAGTHADLMHVQRTAGNAAASSLVAPVVQRVVGIEDVDASVASPQPTASGPAGPGSGAAPADAGPAADHTITASHIGLNAPMVEAPGVIRAQTVVADSIVASSYTPGAGNQW